MTTLAQGFVRYGQSRKKIKVRFVIFAQIRLPPLPLSRSGPPRLPGWRVAMAGVDRKAAMLKCLEFRILIFVICLIFVFFDLRIDHSMSGIFGIQEYT
jgi:hypothetical protein